MPPFMGFSLLKTKLKPEASSSSSSSSHQLHHTSSEQHTAFEARHHLQNPHGRRKKETARLSCIEALAFSSAFKLTDITTKYRARSEASGSSASTTSKAKSFSSSLSGDGTRRAEASHRTRVTRKNFSATKTVLQDDTFTNHESLPSMERAYKRFFRLYPEYNKTLFVDDIRAQEYPNLDESGHVCLDYSGYGLFSKWQETWHKTSASFGLSYISVNLPAHSLYGAADEGTAEFDIRKQVSEFLKVQDSEYVMVFTASRGAAFKLLGESYPFDLNKRLLSVYDYESDALSWLEEAARRKGAEIVSAKFRWPSLRLWATDLRRMLLEKKKNKNRKKDPGKGLFVFPVQSRVTGAKYSYQWMSQAQEHGWDILLDASALGPNAMCSLGLSVFRPDFIVSSFFKVYGSDPTGFGCLLIKRSAIQRLHSSSAARGVGMVRLVAMPMVSEGPVEDGTAVEVDEACKVRADSSMRLSESTPVGFRFLSSGHESLPSASGELVTIERDDECSRDGVSQAKHQQEKLDAERISEPYTSDDYQHLEVVDDLGSVSIHDERNGFPQDDLDCLEGSRSSTFIDSPAENGAMPQEDQHHGGTGQQVSTTVDNVDLEDASSPYGDYDYDVDDDDGDDGGDGAGFVSGDDYEDADVEASVVARKEPEIVCRGLYHVDRLGLSSTNTRLRCLVNWLVASMLKLYHPGSQDAQPLVQIYGPKVSYDRGASVAFNLFDWNGNLLQPLLVQRLADRNNISLGLTTLNNVCIPKSNASLPSFLQQLDMSGSVRSLPSGDRNDNLKPCGGHLDVIMLSLSFLSTFADVYKFWVFLAKFLDADFVSKDVWRYRSLNQETVLLGIEGNSKSLQRSEG